MSSENQCTGCGATVTQGQDGNILDLPDFRDVTGSLYCLTTNGLMRWPYARHSVELPPVAIKPEVAQCPKSIRFKQAMEDFIFDNGGDVSLQRKSDFVDGYRAAQELLVDYLESEIKKAKA